MAILTIEKARAHLRVDDDYPESQILDYLEAAEDAAQEFMNRRVFSTTEALTDAVLAGTAGLDPMVVTPSIRAGILLILGHLFANREDTVVGAAVSELPRGSMSLLQPYRTGMGV